MKKIALYVFMSTALLSAVHTYTAEDNQFVSNLRGAFSSRSGLFGNNFIQNNDKQEENENSKQEDKNSSRSYLRTLSLTGPGTDDMTDVQAAMCIASAKKDGTVPGWPGVRVVDIEEPTPIQVTVRTSKK